MNASLITGVDDMDISDSDPVIVGYKTYQAVPKQTKPKRKRSITPDQHASGYQRELYDARTSINQRKKQRLTEMMNSTLSRSTTVDIQSLQTADHCLPQQPHSPQLRPDEPNFERSNTMQTQYIDYYTTAQQIVKGLTLTNEEKQSILKQRRQQLMKYNPETMTTGLHQATYPIISPCQLQTFTQEQWEEKVFTPLTNLYFDVRLRTTLQYLGYVFAANRNIVIPQSITNIRRAIRRATYHSDAKLPAHDYN